MDATALVEQVKKLQRESAEWKQAWWQYCADHGGNTRNPSSHPAEFLQAFLDSTPLSPATTTPATQDMEVLVQHVKALQRASDAHKMAWVNWCAQIPGGSRDPGLHDGASLSAFIQSVGLAPAMPHPSTAAPATGPLAQLVQQVKAVQKTPEGKEGWAEWCAGYGTASRDPALYDASFLVQFLQSHLAQASGQGQRPFAGAAPRGVAQYQVPSRGYGRGAMQAPALNPMPRLNFAPQAQAHLQMPAPMAMGSEAVKAQLVEAVKSHQRASAEARQAWEEHCGAVASGSRDPRLHDVGSLQYFLASLMGPAPAKRMRVTPPQGMGMGTSLYTTKMVPPVYATPGMGHAAPHHAPAPGLQPQNDEHALLIQQVKACQRVGGEWPAAWGQFCEEVQCLRDPAHHPPEQLRTFLQRHGLSPAEVPKPNASDADTEDPAHTALAIVVKTGQASSTAWKEAWVAHCERHGGTRDPRRHTLASLQTFVDEHRPLLDDLAAHPAPSPRLG